MRPTKFTVDDLIHRIEALEKSFSNGKDYSAVEEESKSLLKDYFLATDGGQNSVFAPDVGLSPTLRSGGGLTPMAFGQVLDLANRLTRISRHAHFFGQLHNQPGNKPVVVSKGDSWFQFPVALKDIIDILMGKKEYLIFSLDKAGDTVQNMASGDDYYEALDEYESKTLILSAGGNDALGNGELEKHLKEFESNLKAKDYLLPSFDALLDKALGDYATILGKAQEKDAKTICHGYAYNGLTQRGKWLSEPMERRQINDHDLRKAIVEEMVDRFNTKLSDLILSKFPDTAIYVNVKNLVPADLWFDEIHPNHKGFVPIANALDNAIKKVLGLPAPNSP